MMNLAQASAYFDRLEVDDADTGDLLFLAQVDPYAESVRDAGAAYRRVLSVKPGTAVPRDRGLRVLDLVWLAGNMEPDGLDQLHRQKYVLQPAERVSLSTLDGHLAGTFPTLAWAGIEWTRDVKEGNISSQVTAQYNGYFPALNPPAVNSIVQQNGLTLLVRAVREMASGFAVAILVKLEAPVQTVSVSYRTYDPVSGSYTPTATVDTPALRTRWQDLFEYTDQADGKFREGDDVMVFRAQAMIDSRARITAAGQAWTVQGTQNLPGVTLAHVRRA
jgi:hypothetical protein